MKKLLVIVFTHYQSERTLNLNLNLVSAINKQTEKSDKADFVLFVNDKTYEEGNLIVPIYPDTFKETVIVDDKYISLIRNKAIQYAIKNKDNYSHVAFIDGDDNIMHNYVETLSRLMMYCHNYIHFSGIWMDSQKNPFTLLEMPQDSIKYVNWLYLWNITWLEDTKLTYPEVSHDWAEDELFFTKLRLLHPYVIRATEDILYIYNHFNCSISKEDSQESDIITSYLNHIEVPIVYL